MNLPQQPERVRAALEPLLEQLRVFGSSHEQEKPAPMDRMLTPAERVLPAIRMTALAFSRSRRPAGVRAVLATVNLSLSIYRAPPLLNLTVAT